MVDQRPDEFGIGHLFWLTSEAIVAADLDTSRIVLWNPAAERLFGYPPADAIGMPLEVLVPDELRSAHLHGLARYATTGEGPLVGQGAVDVPAITSSGERLDVALSLTDLREATKRPIVLAVIRDVSAQRQAEREREQAYEAMRAFVAGASHDLRTPLASVLGFAEMIIDSQISDEARNEALRAILRGARQASRLVDDLLTLSQIQAGVMPSHPESVQVSGVVLDAADLAAVDVLIDVDPELLARVDEHHLHRMVINYLNNAARHGSPPIRVQGERVDHNIVIRVRDAGSGVPEELAGRLFSPFARGGSASSGGAGLGLSIVRGLAQANGGDAFYELTGEGPCFGLVLPAA